MAAIWKNKFFVPLIFVVLIYGYTAPAAERARMSGLDIAVLTSDQVTIEENPVQGGRSTAYIVTIGGKKYFGKYRLLGEQSYEAVKRVEFFAKKVESIGGPAYQGHVVVNANGGTLFLYDYKAGKSGRPGDGFGEVSDPTAKSAADGVKLAKENPNFNINQQYLEKIDELAKLGIAVQDPQYLVVRGKPVIIDVDDMEYVGDEAFARKTSLAALDRSIKAYPKDGVQLIHTPGLAHDEPTKELDGTKVQTVLPHVAVPREFTSYRRDVAALREGNLSPYYQTIAADGKSSFKKQAAGKRVVVIPDIHGDPMVAIRLLQEAKVIDATGNWIAGDNVHLLFSGDIVNRGPDSASCMKLVVDMKRKAERHGSQFDFLMGNHELELLNNSTNLRFWKDEQKLTKRLNEFFPGETSLSSDAMLKKMLRDVNDSGFAQILREASLGLVIGDVYYTHGGPGAFNYPLKGQLTKNGVRDRLDEMNATLREIVRLLQLPRRSPTQMDFLRKYRWLISEPNVPNDNPMWTRDALYGHVDADEIKKFMELLGVEHIVVGHTPVKSANLPPSLADVVHPADNHLSVGYHDTPEYTRYFYEVRNDGGKTVVDKKDFRRTPVPLDWLKAAPFAYPCDLRPFAG